MNGFIAMVLYFGLIGAWLTHVGVSIGEGAWGMLLVGAIIAPIGIIHGLGIWMGVW